MSGFLAEIDANAAAAADEAAAQGSGGFPPLPAGRYQMDVIKVEGVEKFGGQGGNANKSVVKVRLQVPADSPNGAKRVYFARIPLFTRFAPNEKNPQGATASAFWGFWGKALGWPQEKLILGDMPGIPETQGKRITVTLSAPIPPDDYNPLGSNEASFFDAAAADFAAVPIGKANVKWLDEKGNLIAGAVPAKAGAPGVPSAAPAAPPVWNGAPAAATAPAPPAYGAPAAAAPAPPAYATAPAAVPDPQAPGGVWTPDAKDVAFAGAVGQGEAPAGGF